MLAYPSIVLSEHVLFYRLMHHDDSGRSPSKARVHVREDDTTLNNSQFF